MRESIRKLWGGPAVTYVVFFLLLMGSAVVVASVMANTADCGQTPSSGCGETNSSSGLGEAPSKDYAVQASLTGASSSAQPGSRATHVLGATGAASGVTLTYSWTPPQDAYGFTFGVQPLTAGSSSQPTFIWQGLQPGTSIQVSFNYPQSYGDANSWYVIESLEVEPSSGSNDAVSLTTQMTRSGASSLQEPASVIDTEIASQSSGAVWKLQRWFDFPSASMDTVGCQTWIDFLRDDQAFLAVRMPVQSTGSAGTVRVPFVSGADYPSSLTIHSYVPYKDVYTAPLELRPGRFTYMANALPAAAGELWLAFGVSAGAPACPAGLNLQAGNWTTLGSIYVDLSDEENYCLGCVLPIYYCYEGQDAPLMATMSSLAGAPVSTGEGITCFGPQSQTVGFGMDWEVSGAGSRTVTPPETIRFLHLLTNNTGAAQDFNLSTQSDLPATWHMYGGSDEEPNMAQPIAGAVHLSDGQSRFIWLVSDPLPVDTEPGQYSVRLLASLASAPAESRWADDIIWSGEWVPPATPRPAATTTPTVQPRRDIWLPLLKK